MFFLIKAAFLNPSLKTPRKEMWRAFSTSYTVQYLEGERQQNVDTQKHCSHILSSTCCFVAL